MSAEATKNFPVADALQDSEAGTRNLYAEEESRRREGTDDL